ncbi:MAG: 1-acyl-sn-glycerol-3-phosphate acyltransferase [Clostridia bacterium]|nr:1-acyl-sn-glycerol-3-phosphate acyltransferase [Clostridia bacterium]
MIALYVALAIVCGILGVLILHVLFLFALSLFVRNKEYSKASRFYRSVITYHMRLILFFSRVKVVVSGKEKLAAVKDKFLLVGNHRSDFDPIITAIGLKLKEFAFISKPENFKIPFLGKIAKKCLYLPIDRDNPRNAIKTIVRAAELIKNGAASYGVYPEGTRSKSVNMLPFHDGVFKIAQKAGSPVVVVGVRGSEKVYENAPWKKTVVYVDVVDVIDAETATALSSHELSERVREKIAATTEGK